jgi:hypothetical protein
MIEGDEFLSADCIQEVREVVEGGFPLPKTELESLRWLRFFLAFYWTARS